MKHAAAKEKPAVKNTKIEQIISVKRAQKLAKNETISPVKTTKTKVVKKSDPIVKKINLKKNIVKAVAVVSKSKTTASKSAPILSGKKNEKKKAASAVLVKKTAAKAKKSAPVIVAAKPKVKKKKIEPAVSLQKKQKNTLTKQPVISAVSVQKIKPQTKKPETIAPAMKIPAEIQKIKSAVNIGKINAALKAIKAAQARAARTKKTEKKKSGAVERKSKVVGATVETTALQTKTKPKNIKPIGAAVFRGRKKRYDFQVYPLDFAFENVSAIYVISKRKTDSKKRGHHALVCIGQTDSVVNELRKHASGKCVKKHEANVISILPEQSEKKRLKIEEDLKAAHTIVCNID
ncbi:MAG: hypothetical protein M3525_06435 [Acidobacteriota bacterium]|nr:hypothetical protein [Acidobacteriota bacterium]